MSSLVRTLQKKIMLKRGFQPDYKIKGGKIVKMPFPQFMPKIEVQPVDMEINHVDA